MFRRLGSWLFVTLTVAGVVLSTVISGTPRLAADPGDPHEDTDGDLVPDHVEWVLQLNPLNPDTDGDGVDDFLHAVQKRPVSGTPSPIPRATDHEMRVVASLVSNQNAERDLWLHFMFRFVGWRVPDIPMFETFLVQVENSESIRHDLRGVLTHSLVRMSLLPHPTEGLYVIISVYAAPESEFMQLLPCSIGVEASIGGRTVVSSTYLDTVDAETSIVPTTLVPLSTTEAMIVPLAQGDADNPFWTSGRVCVLRLSVIGRSSAGVWYEIDSARCETRGNLRCPSSCASSAGDVIHISDGIGILTGGG